MPIHDAGMRFYVEKGPFKNDDEHRDYIRKLAEELHSELVDMGASYGTGPEIALAKAVYDFVQQESSAKPSS